LVKQIPIITGLLRSVSAGNASSRQSGLKINDKEGGELDSYLRRKKTLISSPDLEGRQMGRRSTAAAGGGIAAWRRPSPEGAHAAQDQSSTCGSTMVP
jgi:hypothetical protein